MTKHPEQQMVLAKEKRQNSVVGGGGVIYIVEEMWILSVFMWCWERTNVKLSGEEAKTVAGNSSTWRTENIQTLFHFLFCHAVTI